MDGFAGFPLRSSTPRGSAFVEFTREARAAPTPPMQTPAPQSAPSPEPARQESLAIRRGAERVPGQLTGRLNTEGDDVALVPNRALGQLNEGDTLLRSTRGEQQGGSEA